ncbi:MAG: hypothetical protein H7Y36_01065, partial [Armatimonadetes bacterium]|nr:hypothetical protein [Akkermansiaceae bacterium]
LGTGPVVEIGPGSEPIIATACVKRAFDLTVKNIGPLVLVVIIYVMITIAVSVAITVAGWMLGFTNSPFTPPSAGTTATPEYIAFMIGSNLVSIFVSVFLLIGAIRIGLNIVSGKPFSIGMLFGGGRLLIRAFFAYLVYLIMVLVGFALLIFPGIYLALRYSQYLSAIVDKDMGIMEAFAYSSRLTEKNKVNLFVIGLFTIAIAFAGCLALGVGLLFAYPMIWLAWIVAYRWMQYGGRAVLDDPITQKPMLANVEG